MPLLCPEVIFYVKKSLIQTVVCFFDIDVLSKSEG